MNDNAKRTKGSRTNLQRLQEPGPGAENMNGEAKMNKAEEAARDAALERVKREVPVENGGGGLDEVTRDMACVIGWNAAIAYAKRERQWVPIHGEDDLPEGDSEFVLVQWKSGAMSIYSFSFRDDPPSDYEYPVAYMPLPDPYQPKTDGDKAEGE